MQQQPQQPAHIPFLDAGVTDWDAVRRDYATGQFTLRELQAKYGPNASTINRRARKEGWTQDLRKPIRQATTRAVNRAEVAERKTDPKIKEALAEMAATGELPEEAPVSVAEVLVLAEVNKQIILSHRKDLRECREVASALLAELKGNVDDIPLAVRINSVKSVVEAVTKLQAAERIAFALDDDQHPEDALSKLLGDMRRSTLPVAP